VQGAGLAVEVGSMPGEADREDLALVHAFAALNGLEGALPISQVEAEFHRAQEYGGGSAARHPVLRLLPPLHALFNNPDENDSFRQVEPLFADPDPWLRAVAKMIFSQVRLNFGQSAEVATAELREALAGFQRIGERWGIGFTLSQLSDLAAADGDFGQALAWQYEAIALVQEVGIREDRAQMEIKLAHQLWMAGDRIEARRALKQSRVTAEEIGLPEVTAAVEYGTATFARLEGNLDDARRSAERAAEFSANPAFATQFRAMARSAQGLIDAASGDLAMARGRHTEALDIALTTRDAPVIAQVLVGAADLVLRPG
jgi:tetratricopeptide (TPR) repeat protein